MSKVDLLLVLFLTVCFFMGFSALLVVVVVVVVVVVKFCSEVQN